MQCPILLFRNIYSPQTKFGQGKVFIPECHSVHMVGGRVCMMWSSSWLPGPLFLGGSLCMLPCSFWGSLSGMISAMGRFLSRGWSVSVRGRGRVISVTENPSHSSRSNERDVFWDAFFWPIFLVIWCFVKIINTRNFSCHVTWIAKYGTSLAWRRISMNSIFELQGRARLIRSHSSARFCF